LEIFWRVRVQKPVLVFGGTGHYGQFIVSSLVKRQVPLRVVSRNAAKARQLLGEKIQYIEGDITHLETIQLAVKDAGAVVISVSAMTPDQIRHAKEIEYDAILQILAEAQAAGVPRVVYISIFSHRPEILRYTNRTFRDLTQYKLDVEQALASSPLNWTVLGAPPSMELFFAMIRGGKMTVPGGGPPALPIISPVDVGEIAAQTVLRLDLAGQRFTMTGAEALSFPQAAERLSVHSGRPIKFISIPLLPINLLSLLTLPFTPYIRFIYGSICLMNRFPPARAARVPEFFQTLQDTFNYTVTTLEMEAERRGW
jgi:uncharacterized protein YbjT (DUF2867 family)